jgi:hypothetical protein
MSQPEGENILAKLKQSEATGRLDGLEVEYWTGGGQPPPFYRSEQFRLMTVEGKDIAQCATVAYAPAFQPNDLMIKIQAPVQAADVKNVARLLRESKIFAETPPAEKPPKDAISTEVILKVGQRSDKRVFYRQLPQTLAPLKAEVERLVTAVKAQAKHTLWHQGKQIT